VILSLFLSAGISHANAGFFSFIGGLFDRGVHFEARGSVGASAFLLAAPTNIDPQAGQGGAVLSLVGGNSLISVIGPAGSAPDNSYKAGQITLYTVREGDTLVGIAGLFDVNVNTILLSNNLHKRSIIKPGQTLIILPISGVQYVVKSGDTLSKIARRFKSDVQEIIDFNDLSSEALAVGQTIIIPTTEAPVSTPVSRTRVVRRSSGPSLPGYFLKPILNGRRSQGLHGYNGVDLANGCAQPVFASAAGNVLIARASGWNGGYGSYVVIAHPNGTQTLYAHLRDLLTRSGSYVVRGQQIGMTGTSGRSTGCHIHFEVRGARNPF